MVKVSVLASNSYLNSSHQRVVPVMGPSRGTGGLIQSSASSGIFFQGDLQPQALVNPHLSSSFGNTSNSIPGTGHSKLGPVSGDMNNVAINGVPNSAPSVGASSLVTDANSALSGGPHLQRSASFNTDSYIRLPASPMSFSSNNISIFGPSVRDGSSIVQQTSRQDPNGQQVTWQQQGVSSATSLPSIQASQSQIPMVARGSGSFVQDPSNLLHLQKKPRPEIKQEEMQNQQVIRQLLQRQDSLQFNVPQLQALLQQQRLREQQFLQSMPQLQRAQSQQQHMQLREQLQQQAMPPLSSMKRPYDGGVCARRLMQYLYHQHQRPQDNNIMYWRKFVSEYYSPRAKKRWCLSLYENVGHHALGAFPQTSMDGWQCDICGSKSGKGFETTCEVLPILNKIKFGSGVIDELLFVDLPRECRFPSGIMMLEYGKAVQESVYEQLRVVREGHLRIIFTKDLKILSWEFCARRHEELLPCRLVQPQVNQLVQVAQKCQNTISESGCDGISQQDLQTNSNMALTAGHQLAKSLELQSLNDLGFSKRYVRCLQISEVVNSMKDLIDFCREHKAGPIDGLKNYPRHAAAPKLQMQKMQDMEQIASVQGLATDRNAIDKVVPLHSNQIGSNHNLVSRVALSGSAQAAMQLNNFQNLLLRQNSMNSNSNSLQQEASSSFNPNHIPPSAIRGATTLNSGSLQNLPVRGLSSSHLGPQHLQMFQQRTLGANSLLQQCSSQSSQGNQPLQQQMIHQFLQEMSNNGGGLQPHSLAAPNSSVGMVKSTIGLGGNPSSLEASTTNISGSNGPAPSRSNSFKGASNGDSSAPGANDGFSRIAPEVSQTMHLQDDVVQVIAREFTDTGFFNSNLDDNLGYGWKA